MRNYWCRLEITTNVPGTLSPLTYHFSTWYQISASGGPPGARGEPPLDRHLDQPENPIIRPFQAPKKLQETEIYQIL